MTTTDKSKPDQLKGLRAYFSKIGQMGGKSRSPQKRSSSQANLAKARLNRWKKGANS